MEVELLRNVSIFRALNDDELVSLSRLLVPRSVKAGERILEEGKEVTALYIVCEGIVHVRRMAQKREMLLGRIGVGGFFGEINLFDPGVATASIYAMKKVSLFVIEYETMRPFMESNASLGYKIVSAMMTETARRLRQTSSRLVNSVYWSRGEGVPASRAPEA